MKYRNTDSSIHNTKAFLHVKVRITYAEYKVAFINSNKLLDARIWHTKHKVDYVALTKLVCIKWNKLLHILCQRPTLQYTISEKCNIAILFSTMILEFPRKVFELLSCDLICMIATMYESFNIEECSQCLIVVYYLMLKSSDFFHDDFS